jgi:ferric-dicitrate binding protein FerR (iron transport regulator)
MDRTAFRELLLRYVNGTATPEEKALVDHWYELLYDNKLPALKQEELDNIEQEMWAHIEKEGNIPLDDHNPSSIRRNAGGKRLYYLTAAALVAGLIITALVLFYTAPKAFSYEQSRQQKKLAESINNTAVPQRILLSDGSYVILQPASKIAYSQFDSVKREVYLEGEAFFQVTKDPARPFYVYTNELVTKVLGTSFDVRAFPNDNTIKVMVHTGKVTVYQRKKNEREQELARTNATIITPNQQVMYNRQQANIVKSISVQPQAINSINNKNNVQSAFADAPASAVFMAIQKAYGITIVFDEELMSHCSFTGTFTNETFFERISLVCKAIEATYEQADGQVIISGHDCE